MLRLGKREMEKGRCMIYDKLKLLMRQAKRFGGTPQMSNRRILNHALRSMGCKLKWVNEGDAKVLRFDYQNGHFVIRLAKDTDAVWLCYPTFHSAKMEQLEVVRQVCNQANLNSDRVRLVYNFDTQRNVADIHALAILHLDAKNAKEVLADTMMEMFTWNGLFQKWLEAEVERQKAFGAATSEESFARASRMFAMLREHELLREDVETGMRESTDCRVTLGNWVAHALDLERVIPSRLDVTGAGIDYHVDAEGDKSRREAMAGYLLSDALIADGKFARHFATVCLTFFLPSEPDLRRYLTISLASKGQTDTTLYYQATAVLTPRPLDLEHPVREDERLPRACTATLAYDLSDNKKLAEELRFMCADALDKLRENNLRGLSDEQRFIAGIADQPMAQSLYRGRQLFLDKRYFEALLWLRNAFAGWRSQADSLSDGEVQNFYELCFMLGHCYDELGQYDRAYYYLSLLVHSGQYPYLEELVNNLVCNGDPRALSYIESLLEDVRHDAAEGEQEEIKDDHALMEDSRYQEFFCFLLRRKASVLVDKKQYKEAISELEKMLRHPKTSDFAIKELAYLQRKQRHERREREDKGRANPA